MRSVIHTIYWPSLSPGQDCAFTVLIQTAAPIHLPRVFADSAVASPPIRICGADKVSTRLNAVRVVAFGQALPVVGGSFGDVPVDLFRLLPLSSCRRNKHHPISRHEPNALSRKPVFFFMF